MGLELGGRRGDARRAEACRGLQLGCRPERYIWLAGIIRRVTTAALSVLGIDVEANTIDCWRGWFAPDVQPFIVDNPLRDDLGARETLTGLPREVQDTYSLYGDQTLDRVIGLTRSEFDALSYGLRARLVRHQIAEGRELVPSLRSARPSWRTWLRADGDGYRFVWWRDTLTRCGDEPVLQFVADGVLTSQHMQVHASTWKRAGAVLPGARELAGTFADSSGPNCFGTVMAAAGVSEAADVWMLRETFEGWLSASTRRGGDDAEPGTVLVWRDQLGAVQHSAVTLGDGWALHKPSQGWMSPRLVLSVPEIKRAALQAGHRLTRRAL